MWQPGWLVDAGNKLKMLARRSYGTTLLPKGPINFILRLLHLIDSVGVGIFFSFPISDFCLGAGMDA
jgi:hypothetical protein